MNKLDCDFFFKALIADDTKRAEVCAVYKFDELSGV
jgi:hypothetical protein